MDRRTLLRAGMGMAPLALAPAWAGRALAQTAAPELAFPGALGWAATTKGGRGGQVIKVTNLNGDGPGSFRAAIETKGPRIIVFEVGGVIDLNKQTLKVNEPFVTIAGQTAPSPGITCIRGGMDCSTHDFVMQHIRIRPGEAGAAKKSGWEEDAFSTQGAAYNVIVDHCTMTWATDENLSTSGPRFIGKDITEWRQNTSHRISYTNNIIAEGLALSTHGKIEHSKGSLIHDNITDVLIYGNLYAHNVERNPHMKGGVHLVMVNNLIYDCGQRAAHYNLMAEEWGDHKYEVGRFVAVGNVLRAGPSTPENLAFLEIGGVGDLQFYSKDNIAVDRMGRPLPLTGRYTTSAAKIIPMAAPMLWPTGLVAIPASQVETHVLHNAGARPWDRDKNEVQLISDVAEGRGEIINSENDLHGYPVQAPTARPFNPTDWNMSDMTPRTPKALDNTMAAKGT